MRYAKAVPVILIGVTIACGGGSDAGSTSQGAAAATTREAKAADLPDPCGLVTDTEVSDLLWRGMEANQRDAMRAKGAKHVFTKRVENVETPAGRTCHIQYRLAVGDSTWSEGDFRLRTLARQTFDIFAGSSKSQNAIPGIGDQAFYMSNAAYGRRGDVGVEVVDFSSKDLEIELLKDAVARLK
ncbi:MAG TPA: hypothetical protein VM076_18155 [Gemmatimonadaceae bacterium]|nr:hypothetical protein [Gemmatimonadaceae bacterium]